MLVSNREAFLESNRKSFETVHPHFMSYLRSCGLTDWEVNYCCLYLVGLNGKEIGEYINLKRHYTYGSVIRKKLGLSEHDKNLANHLKNLRHMVLCIDGYHIIPFCKICLVHVC